MKLGVLATTILAVPVMLATLTAYPIASSAQDSDGDGIPDVVDRCSLDSRNATSNCDTDQDGYGNPCDADFDENFVINANDFAHYFIPAFQTTPIPITNSSFELPAITAGTSSTAPVPGWTTVGGGSAGVLQGLGGLVSHPDGSVQNGWSDGPTFTQTFTTNLAADTVYWLIVDIGQRTDKTPPTSITLDLGSSSTVGANLLTPLVFFADTPPSGGWTTWVVYFDSGSSPPGLGLPLRIDITTVTTAGAEAEYDNVRLYSHGPTAGTPPSHGEDMDCNGVVNSNDFSRFFVPKFKGAFGGAVPGPSGLSCAGVPGC